MKDLMGKCKTCFGCNKLEDEEFEGLEDCKGYIQANETKLGYKAKKLSNAEILIMNVIWNKGKTTSFDVINATKGVLSENSIRTLLTRMARKGAVKVNNKRKTNIYTAKISKREFQKKELEEFMELVYENNINLLSGDLWDLWKIKCCENFLNAKYLEHIGGK